MVNGGLFIYLFASVARLFDMCTNIFIKKKGYGQYANKMWGENLRIQEFRSPHNVLYCRSVLVFPKDYLQFRSQRHIFHAKCLLERKSAAPPPPPPPLCYVIYYHYVVDIPGSVCLHFWHTSTISNLI